MIAVGGAKEQIDSGKWGMRLAAAVVDETSNMKHDKGLEHIGERIRSLRRLMRNINRR